MEFAHGLDLNFRNVNLILSLAQKKGYIKYNEIIFKCDDFKFNENNGIFEFHIFNPECYIELNIDKFVECYTELLLEVFKE